MDRKSFLVLSLIGLGTIDASGTKLELYRFASGVAWRRRRGPCNPVYATRLFFSRGEMANNFHIAVSGAIIETRFLCTCIVFARTCGYLKLLLTGKELEPNKTGRSTDLNIFYEIRL